MLGNTIARGCVRLPQADFVRRGPFLSKPARTLNHI